MKIIASVIRRSTGLYVVHGPGVCQWGQSYTWPRELDFFEEAGPRWISRVCRWMSHLREIQERVTPAGEETP